MFQTWDSSLKLGEYRLFRVQVRLWSTEKDKEKVKTAFPSRSITIHLSVASKPQVK